MQTNFTAEQLTDPRLAEADRILKRCVHCGLCTAVCSTYVVLGDERDSPRGRIYLMKDMFERERRARAAEGAPASRPLPELPLVHDDVPERRRLHASDRPGARPHRGDGDRAASRSARVRTLLAFVVPYPGRFRLALKPRPWRAPLSPLLMRRFGFKELAAMIELAPTTLHAAAHPSTSGPGTAVDAKRAARARHSARGLRPAGAAPRHQRRHHPPARAARRRRHRLQRRRLLRRARPPSRARGRGEAQARRNVDAWSKEMRARARSTPSSSTPRAAARRSRTTATCCRTIPAYAERARQDLEPRQGRLGVPGRVRARRARALVVAARRLSLGVLAAARPAHPRRAAVPAAAGGLRGRRRARGPHLLRLGRHLQYPAARDRRRAQGPQDQEHPLDPGRRGRGRQHRLHHAARTAASTCRSCTRSSCWTGPTAAPCRAASSICADFVTDVPRPKRPVEDFIEA